MAPAKSKAQKMSIGTFLADESLGSWADEMDDIPIPFAPLESRGGFGGFGGERRFGGATVGYSQDERGFHREELPLPAQPPYTAHIGNLSFDATQDDISGLFEGCEVTSVRVVEDKLTGAPKGFGYVEFATVDGLKKALTFQGASLQGRNIRVSVAEPPKDRGETRDFSDWSRKGPLPELPNQRRVPDRGGFGSRAMDNMSDAGSERGGRRGYEQAGDGKPRDFSNWERKGPLSPSLQTATLGREGGRTRSKEAPQFRKASPAWGEGRSQDGSRPPRREFQERPVERAPTAPELDNQWRARMRPDAPAPPPAPVSHETPGSPTAAAPPAPAPAPTVRPKLNLQKRTVAEATASPTASTDSKSSPFGGARPIDTFSREKEVEEKRELALRQKKEADEKAKAERAEKEKLAKEQEQERVKAKMHVQDVRKEEANGSKEASSADSPQQEKNVEILKREEETAGKPKTDVKEGAVNNGEKTEAPQEKSRQAPPTRPNNSWRSGGSRGRGGAHPQGSRNQHHQQSKGSARQSPSDSTPAPAPPTTDEDGWSTVSAKQKNNRRGNYSQRGHSS